MEQLAQALMDRIEEAMPHMGVPLLARLLLEADGPVSHDELMRAAAAEISAQSDRFLLTEGETPAELAERELVTVDAGMVVPDTFERPLLEFYARSISDPDPGFSAAAQ